MTPRPPVPATPGPWTLETVKTQVGVCHKIGPFPGSSGRKVGMACVYEDGMHLWSQMATMDSELLSNARLMAAAPDLLAAARIIVERSESMCQGDVLDTRELEAAIFKAEGR